MLLKYVSRISKLPSDMLVEKAFTHASSVNTLWWQKLSLWLSQHRFEGVLAEGTFSLVNAEQHLRDKWYHGICQSSATKVSFFTDNMIFEGQQEYSREGTTLINLALTLQGHPVSHK